MGGLVNAEATRELNCKFFTPSSIGAFGPSTPKDNTPKIYSASYYDVWGKQSGRRITM